jgi:hypothetical protein
VIGILMLVTNLGAGSVHAADSVTQHVAMQQGQRHANFNRDPASSDATRVADWVVASADNHGMPFMVVDKINAQVFVFHANGQLRGATPALLGSALGDDSARGIGDRKLSDILPEERTTPGGRFVASLDRNLQGAPVLWVDYATAVSMHPVITSNPLERRAQRLATPTPLDNRISYGCINVPALFFKNVVIPGLRGTNAVVYILPEVHRLQDVFPLVPS